MDQGYYRYPAIAQNKIVFVCEDDLWSVDAGGGVASRLTVTPGQCVTPRLSPDGKWIAFFADDEGHLELHVMPAAGGPPQRLTYFGSTMGAVSTWSADSSNIYFTSNRNAWYERATHGFVIARDGQARALQLGHMKSLSLGPGGAMVLGRNSEDCARWKRYRGGTAGDLWIDATGAGIFSRLIATGGNPVWPMWIGERIYFIDDHEGVGNLYSCLTNGTDLRRHTDEREYYARYPSTDGQRIVYQAGGEIRLFDIESERVVTVPISCASAAPQTARRFIAASEELEHFAPHPDGTGLALISRGQAYTMPYWEEAAVHHGSGSGARNRLCEWLPDGNRFACVTDRNGFEQIEIHETQVPGKARILTKTDIGRVAELATSPAAECIAVANHRHELLLIDGASGDVRVVDKSQGNRITDPVFSPDGRWVAYCWWPTTDTSIVRIARVKSGKVHDVTPVLRTDSSPAWDPEGNYLYFISTRDFHPVYDALQFDLSFPQAMRPFVVTLRDDVCSPFLPKPRPVHRDHDRDHYHDDEKKNEKPEPIDIDFDGITGRVLGFPVDEGDYGQIVAAKRRVLFTRFEVRGLRPASRSWDEVEESGTLLAYDFEQQRMATIAQDCGDIRLAADHRTLLYRSHERLRAIDAQMDLPEEGDENKPPAEAGRKSGWLDLERISVEINPRAEWAQMYREAWRLQREHFWVADMSEVDWTRVFERYKLVLPRVRTRLELSDLIWEMQGELGTSHAYEYGGDVRIPPQYSQGFLGADFSWDEREGGYKIERIYRGDSWNREHDSPLAEPGLGIREGDVLIAIAGKRLTTDFTPEEALVNTAEREVTLAIEGKKNNERRLLVKTLADERGLRYRAWVEANRALVHEQTGGKVGYVHIPDMGPWGFSEFHRGYLTEFDRQGLIVDVRYNRGGHVSPLLLEKLARKRVGYDVSRYGPPQPYPPESVGGAIVAITNQFAGSDGDIFSHCFKLYDLGPLVGKRTWGGVIGINPYHRLVDGTITTQPEFSFWFTDVGWNVENYGTDPDYDVDIAPHDYRDGNDPQMTQALALIKAALKNVVDPRPQLETRPSLKLP
jgi:tricorn protease